MCFVLLSALATGIIHCLVYITYRLFSFSQQCANKIRPSGKRIFKWNCVCEFVYICTETCSGWDKIYTNKMNEWRECKNKLPVGRHKATTTRSSLSLSLSLLYICCCFAVSRGIRQFTKSQLTFCNWFVWLAVGCLVCQLQGIDIVSDSRCCRLPTISNWLPTVPRTHASLLFNVIHPNR